MQDITKRWVDFAKEDLKAAEALIIAPESFRSYQLSVLHCHQAVEKILKAVLVEQGKEVLKIHDLARLALLTEMKLPHEHDDFIRELDPHYTPPRYPDLPSRGRSFHYNEPAARSYLERTKQLFVWIEQQLISSQS
ncbi:hypothetical protein A3J43_03195 [Candidatus Uhrbacteria bacterium RIFCSPHIGHO2_12_FULL_54_23]|uniref:HEPN domain-containing protein n=2 Tax=Candidatus Uhriibacteriota TaxID=1752732 RepID=A0A1F7ULV0_9BACT|nr:MAG: hypothetical protein A3J43_03195 [Candidatus Uhrbacteria bacterium RIFCSPHIGHO2_12_FULL_54_23]OGL90711.1 MAG: hypothetical protein A3J36_02550 [Candidatus Uhrbacteria bacterium RIFCSPLOWO2_02_FULL_54_37]